MRRRNLQAILFAGVLFLMSGCSNDPLSGPFCKGATASSYDPNFQVMCPTQGPDSFVPVYYGCPPAGKGISPPIQWSGLPEGTTHLRILVEDTTCAYECNECCKYDHWVLDLPLMDLPDEGVVSKQGIREGASTDPAIQPYVLPNTSNKKQYMPFCPPPTQTHAYLYRATAYKKEGSAITVLGRSQSVPLLYSFTH